VKRLTAKQKDIIKLVKIQKSEEFTERMLTELLVAIGGEALKDKIMRYLDVNEMIMECYIPAFSSAFTHADIKGLINFYEGHLGQKLVRVNPTIQKVSQEAGMEYASKVMMRINESSGQEAEGRDILRQAQQDD